MFRWALSISLKWAACWVCGSSSSVTPCYWDHWSWASSWPRSSLDAARFVSLSQTCFPAPRVVFLTPIWRFAVQPLISTHLASTNKWALLYFSNQKIKITIQSGARGNTFNPPSDYFSPSPKSEIFNFSKSREVKRSNRSAFYFPASHVNNSAAPEIICETHLWLVSSGVYQLTIRH